MNLPVAVTSLFLAFAATGLHAAAPQPWASIDVENRTEGLPGKWKSLDKKLEAVVADEGIAVCTNRFAIEGEYEIRISVYGQPTGEEGESAAVEVVWQVLWRLDRGTHLRGIMREVQSGFVPVEIENSKAAFKAVSEIVEGLGAEAARLILENNQAYYDGETWMLLDWGWRSSGTVES
jgi:hypothetical protein